MPKVEGEFAFYREDIPGGVEKTVVSLIEKQKIPVEPAVTIAMTMITQAIPDLTDEELGLAWRTLHDKYLKPSIGIRARKKPFQ